MNIFRFTVVFALLATVSWASPNLFPYKIQVEGNWAWSYRPSTFYPLLSLTPGSEGIEVKTQFYRGYDSDDLQNFTMTSNFRYEPDDQPTYYADFYVTMFDIYILGSDPAPGLAPADAAGLPYNLFAFGVYSSPHGRTFTVKFGSVNQAAGITCPKRTTSNRNQPLIVICRGPPAESFIKLTISMVRV